MTGSALPAVPLRLVASDGAASAEVRAWWVLRLGAALCFIGHGAFGFIGKAAWLPYFGVVGIPESWGWSLMPWVGALDVTAGMWILFAPTRLPLIYMSVWALWTAMLRPLAGESAFEMIERAGNYGVPLALLLAAGVPRTLHAALEPLSAGMTRACPLPVLRRALHLTVALLLLGHGGLGAFVGTDTLARHYATIGLPAGAVPMIGWFEIALAAAVLAKPVPPLLLFVAAWKVTTESLFYASGAPIWEVVERAGSYAAPVALAWLLTAHGRDGDATARRVPPGPGARG